MRTKLLSILAAFALTAAAGAQTTALTYQGRLRSGGQPASGLHDLRFRLFDAAQGGTQLGSTQCLNNVAVADGLFTAAIDFGQQFASPDQRFLEIQVRQDAGKGCGDGAGFVTLNPRQPLTAAPLASHANSAFALDAADGGPLDAVFVDNAGRVGIGTQAPTHSVTVAVPEPTLALRDTDANGTQVGYVSYRNADDVEMAWVGYGTPGSPHFSIVNARSGGNIALWPFSGGVGIGTDEPLADLDVRGDIRFGPGGAGVQAAGGVENLRLLRGSVDGNGTKDAGAGFTSQRLGEGWYKITFDSPFSAVPSVTATAQWDQNDMRAPQIDGIHTDSFFISMAFPGNFNQTDSDFSFIVIGPR